MKDFSPGRGVRERASKFCTVTKENDSLLTQGGGNGNVAGGLEGREGPLHQTCSKEFLHGWREPSEGAGRALLLLQVAAGVLVDGITMTWHPQFVPS